MRGAQLFLQIAKENLDRAVVKEGAYWAPGDMSHHYREAMVCSLFSAIAVEHSITEVLWTRVFFQTPKPFRSMLMKSLLSRPRSVEERLDLLASVTRLSGRLLDDVRELFRYRNTIVHSRPESSEEAPHYDSLNDTWDTARTISYPEPGNKVIEHASIHLELARQVVAVLESEEKSPEWPYLED